MAEHTQRAHTLAARVARIGARRALLKALARVRSDFEQSAAAEAAEPIVCTSDVRRMRDVVGALDLTITLLLNPKSHNAEALRAALHELL